MYKLKMIDPKKTEFVAIPANTYKKKKDAMKEAVRLRKMGWRVQLKKVV